MSTDTGDGQDRATGEDGHGVEVIVNGRPKTVTSKMLTFDQVVSLAYDNPPTGPDVRFTVSYRRGEGNKPDGTLVQGGTVKVKTGMVFNVGVTDKS